MKNKLKTAAVSEPVSLAEMRTYLGIVQTSDTGRDTVIQGLITAARIWAEQYTRNAIVPQTWELCADNFEGCLLLLSPAQSVTSVKYKDAAGILQTLSPTVYTFDSVDSAVYLVTGQSWPSLYTGKNNVIIEYIAGSPAVSNDIKLAIKLLAAHWERYQTSIEGATVTTVPYAVNQLLDNYRDMRGYFNADVSIYA